MRLGNAIAKIEQIAVVRIDLSDDPQPSRAARRPLGWPPGAVD
jgi:hypothetical protein